MLCYLQCSAQLQTLHYPLSQLRDKLSYNQLVVLGNILLVVDSTLLSDLLNFCCTQILSQDVKKELEE